MLRKVSERRVDGKPALVGKHAKGALGTLSDTASHQLAALLGERWRRYMGSETDLIQRSQHLGYWATEERISQKIPRNRRFILFISRV